MKSIYSDCYNLYSGFTKNYLDKSYASTYARRKSLCGQDEMHSEIVSSSNVNQAQGVNSATGNNDVNNEVSA